MDAADRRDRDRAEAILARIARTPGMADALAVLRDGLGPGDLQSLLLEVARARAGQLTPADVLRRYAESRFTAPGPVDPRALAAFDRLAFAVATPAFEPLELSPVAPLGAVSALTGLDQNVAVATMRTGEVVSDPTNVMALECARRRSAPGTDRAGAPAVALCASHRVVRGQRYADPAARAHFRMFALCTAGRAGADWRFEVASLDAHLRVHLALLARVRDLGLDLAGAQVTVTSLDDGPEAAFVDAAVLEPLRRAYPFATAALDPDRAGGRAYYTRLCFDVTVTARDGRTTSIADGGFTGWTAAMLGDRKERLLVSAIGNERTHEALGAAGPLH